LNEEEVWFGTEECEQDERGRRNPKDGERRKS